MSEQYNHTSIYKVDNLEIFGSDVKRVKFKPQVKKYVEISTHELPFPYLWSR